MTSPLFVITSDLGTDSPAVAQLKAVLLAKLPLARIQDLTNAIPPQSIRDAELALRSAAFMFPPNTVHLVVVDPGVGTERRALAVQAEGQYFVGPDNGVLGQALDRPGARAVELTVESLWRHPVANTFHGRDIFAPVAAHLAAGHPLEEVGSPIDDFKPSTIPAPLRKDQRTLVGETLGADRFGNLTTNIPMSFEELHLGETWVYEVDGQIIPYRSTYMAAKIGRTIVTAGADRFLEVAVTQGSAAEYFGRAEGIEIYCANRSAQV